MVAAAVADNAQRRCRGVSATLLRCCSVSFREWQCRAGRVLLPSGASRRPTWRGAGRRGPSTAVLGVVVAVFPLVAQRGRGQSSPTVYEGARLIIGDLSATIEDGSLVVQDGRIVAVGRR